MSTIRWFLSSQVRNAVAMRKHVHRLLCAQRDLLTTPAIENLQQACDGLTTAIREGARGEALKKEMTKLEEVANKWLKPYPHANWRENVEVLLVALAVAMAIRTFFIQPFKIPTGSMQPTLFGVTSVPNFQQVRSQSEADEQIKLASKIVIPTGWQRVKEWFEGVSYVRVVAQVDGTLDKIEPPVGIKLINFKQIVWIGGVPHTIWFPPDCGESSGPGIDALQSRAGLAIGRSYRKGDTVLMMRVAAGDHLFVDRMSYNFRKPTRGEIIVFETRGINNPDAFGVNRMPQDQFYIKRMVVMPGEKVQIGNDRHLIINGERLDASTPHFENVYSFDPKMPPEQSKFSGHLNATVAASYGQYADFPYFPTADTVYENPGDSYMVMGDNTCNSSDSRCWGSFPARNVIGKSFFVYWPITARFGWGNQ
jgi:signal peptidase I